MKRRDFLKKSGIGAASVAAAAVGAATLIGCEKKQEEEKKAKVEVGVKWRAGSTWTPAINLIETDRYFIKIVNQMAGGRMSISHHPAGEIVGAFELFDAVSKGALEGGFDWPSYWSGKNSAFDLLGSVSFWFTPADYYTWVYQGGGLELIRELFAKYNMHYIPTGMTPSESGFRTNKPIKSLEDYKGLKLRAPLAQNMYILQQIGANPVKLPGGEIYMALKLGTIDGAEFSNASADYGMKFAEVTKYWNVPCWFQPSSLLGLMINLDAWKKLPDDLKAIMEEAGKATVLWGNAFGNWTDIAATNDFIKQGTTITKLPAEDLAKLEKLSVQFMEIEAAKNPDYKKMVQSMMTYMKNYEIVRDWQGEWSFGRNPTIYPKLD